MTKEEYIDATRQVLNEYFVPIFQIIGGVTALIVIGLAVYMVVSPFIRRIS